MVGKFFVLTVVVFLPESGASDRIGIRPAATKAPPGEKAARKPAAVPTCFAILQTAYRPGSPWLPPFRTSGRATRYFARWNTDLAVPVPTFRGPVFLK